MKTVAIIQARMGSTRLPGKVLMDLEGKPMLERVVSRCKRAALLTDLIVATTIQAADDPIISLCSKNEWKCFRGSEDDVLDRYYHAAKWSEADIIVRITSDCPLIDSELIDQCIKKFMKNPRVDYVSNSLPPRSFPRGLDVEVLSFAALKRAWYEDQNTAWREHVTPYIYRHPEIFKIRAVKSDLNFAWMRWCVDTMEDLIFIRKIYHAFKDDSFSWREVLAVLCQNKNWLEINRAVSQKKLS